MATSKRPPTERKTGTSPTRPRAAPNMDAADSPRPSARKPRAVAPPRRSEPPPLASENTASRAFQAFILVLGVMMLFGFFFGLEWGTVTAGLLIFASAFPPVRRYVDRWLVGASRGPEADQSAIIRMLVGAVVTILGLILVF